MNHHPGRLRAARREEIDHLLGLWDVLFEELEAPTTGWRTQARDWLTNKVDDRAGTRIPVVELDAGIVAAAVGTLEVGLPNPHCPRGRMVRLENVITRPGHRGRGYATELVRDVIGWARNVVDADRIDLSATPDGQRIYERLGFVGTSAPRMKLVL